MSNQQTPAVSGRARMFRIVESPDGEVRRFDFARFNGNAVMKSWAEIVGPLLRGEPDGLDWRIAGMYLEFENNGGGVVATPTIDRTETLDYYNDLSGHPTRDYLRVPLSYSTQAGDLLTFFGRSSGLVGVHGKPCTAVAQSRFYGGALVAFPVPGDATRDVVFSRIYFADGADQRIKGVGEIMFEWPVTLG